MNSKPKPLTRENVLTNEEIEKLQNACRNKIEELIVKVGLYTGLRVSEFIHLRKSWISENGKTLKIPKMMKCDCKTCSTTERWKKLRDPKTKEYTGKIELIKPKGYWMPKSSQGERVIYISKKIRGNLLSYFENHNKILEVVPNRIMAWRIVKAVEKRIKIKHKVFPHCFRGTYATILDSKGYDTISITNILGWSKPEMAMRYIKLNEDAVTKLGEEKFDNG